MSKAQANERRLAVILFTDVVGYSARMQRDETGTLALVRADFERLRAHGAQHGGEVLNTMGDGMLLSFSSAVQAVTCALAAQEEFSARGNAALQHRMGIHLGDVFRQADGGVAGDGVNLAARLQTKAQPGTVCLSQSVFDAVKGKVPMQVTPLGAQTFKNILEPVSVFLVAPAGHALPVASRTAGRRLGWLGLGVVAAAALGVFLWLSRSAPSGLGATGPRPVTANPAPAADIPDRSIAVLPFTNMSDDKENAYFADGVHEDILTHLANVGGLKVISRTSVSQYRQSSKSLREIGTELGVAYILEGSVRRAENKIRVTGQLINAATDEHVWAKTYDRDLTDIFSVQAELATAIASALQIAITPQKKATLATPPTTSLQAYDHYTRARLMMEESGLSRDALRGSMPLLEQAVQLDPRFAEGWATLAFVNLQNYLLYQGASDQLAKAREALATAIRLAPTALRVLVTQRFFQYAFDEVELRIKSSEQIAQLYPNHVETRLIKANEAWAAGRWREALDETEQALSLDPRGIETLNFALGYHLALRRYDQVEKLWRVIEGVRPLSEDMRWKQAMNRFTRSGSVQEGDALLASYSAEALRSDSRTVANAAFWNFWKGDAATMLRLWRESGTNWRFSNQYSGFDHLSVATCLMKQGQREEALPLLRKERERLMAQFEEHPDSWRAAGDLAVALALLGEVDAADRQLAKMADIAGSTKNRASRGNINMYMACVLAWLDRKTQAIDLFANNINEPGIYEIWRIHEVRHGVLWWPLQGDPRFEALLNDPKNNAPLF